MTTDEKRGLPRTEEVALLASEQRTVDQLAGTVLLDRYRLLEPLGEGGAAVVYRAEHSIMHKPLAVKILRPEHAARPDFVRRFLSEARTVARLRHDNIVDVVDIGRTESGVVFCVMEWLDGEDLGATIERDGPMPWARAQRIVLQVCRALVAAHGEGIVHRDIKPHNCFRVLRGRDRDFVKVLDFGIAKDIGATQKLTMTGVIMGTAGYMPPEQARGVAVDVRADVYAVGALLFELLSARPVFDGENFFDVMMLQATSPAPRLSRLVPDVPPVVDDIVARALERDRDGRFGTMTELATAIMNVGRRMPIGSAPDPPSAGEAAPAVEGGGTVVAPPPTPGAQEVAGELGTDGGTVVAPPPTALPVAGHPQAQVPAVDSWPPPGGATASSPVARTSRAPLSRSGPYTAPLRSGGGLALGVVVALVVLSAAIGLAAFLMNSDDVPLDPDVERPPADPALVAKRFDDPESVASPPAGVGGAWRGEPDTDPPPPLPAAGSVPEPDEENSEVRPPDVGREGSELPTPLAEAPDEESNDPPGPEPAAPSSSAPSTDPAKPSTPRSKAQQVQARVRRRIRHGCATEIRETKTVYIDPLSSPKVRIVPPNALLKTCVENTMGKIPSDVPPFHFPLRPKAAR